MTALSPADRALLAAIEARDRRHYDRRYNDLDEGWVLADDRRELLRIIRALEDQVELLEADGEAICHRCGGPNLLNWHAPSPLWNAVMRADSAEPFDGIVCPRCFADLAVAAGVVTGTGWCLTYQPMPDLPTVFGDGRRWGASPTFAAAVDG